MIDVLKNFYLVHYNFGAVFALMLLLVILFAVKKNVKGIIILLALIIIGNVAIYSRTNGKAWTRDFYMTDEYEDKFPLYMKVVKDPVRQEFNDSTTFTFAANSEKFPWVIVDSHENSDKIFHWCWVDDAWQSFASISLVDKLWGSKQVNDARKSSENRVGELE